MYNKKQYDNRADLRGSMLANYRKKAGYSQEQVSELLHISKDVISRWERGLVVPDINMCFELADFYDAPALPKLMSIGKEVYADISDIAYEVRDAAYMAHMVVHKGLIYKLYDILMYEAGNNTWGDANNYENALFILQELQHLILTVWASGTVIKKDRKSGQSKTLPEYTIAGYDKQAWSERSAWA